MLRGLLNWQLWGRLGWQDVALRYRRSMLGPFWLTISMGIMVFALAYVYGGIFKIQSQHYIPYLYVGLLTWNLITSIINEGCQTFIEAEGYIRQVDLPLFLFPLRVVWRNLLLFLHNALIYFVLIFIYDLQVDWKLLLATPGLIALIINGLWCATLLGMLAARFRDFAQIASNLLQVVFFATPIIWTAEQSSGRPLLAEGNPFFHFIEIVRQPLLGKVPSLLNWYVVMWITLSGCVGTYFFYRRFHGRIVYWV